MAVEELRRNAMMSHLLDALDEGKDIGHYGRLVFAMVARHFMGERELVRYLEKSEGLSDGDAWALAVQVNRHDYSPPTRERILQWQGQQEFPICPNADDPDACNVYRDLKFPGGVYENISEFYEEKAEAEKAAA
jgi:hypothetical protein